MISPSPVLISVAPNGARRTHADHAALPISAREIASEAEACRASGAGMLHLHVRDEQGSHSLDPARYREAIEAIDTRLGGEMLIQITTEACGIFEIEQQMACVREVRPAAASFAIREFFPNGIATAQVQAFFEWVAATGVQPQFIVYVPEEVRQLHDLLDRRQLPFDAPPVLFVLGRYGDGPASNPLAIPSFAEPWNDRGHWSVCAFGPTERAVGIAALALGGHVRVGFENNLWRPDGTLLQSTAEQVSSIAAAARLLSRPLSIGFAHA
ncbi:MAG TPA: 3-keto-5-aminohexanoate cleavage protein [Sphingomonas sp.]|nr:3-keto-5-aminohexanoate cleavage protein [Sphingomonas sp.]